VQKEYIENHYKHSYVTWTTTLYIIDELNDDYEEDLQLLKEIK
jgi:hypothetical protein